MTPTFQTEGNLLYVLSITNFITYINPIILLTFQLGRFTGLKASVILGGDRQVQLKIKVFAFLANAAQMKCYLVQNEKSVYYLIPS